jgi:hypothetical protein
MSDDLAGVQFQTTWALVGPMKALRALVQGRVLLKSDYTGGLTIPVGRPTNEVTNDGLQGTGMFRGNSLNLKLVEPSADGLSVDHEEDVEIEEVHAWPLNLTLTEPASLEYTVDRGAYVTWQVLPAAVEDLKVVQHDQTLPAADPGTLKFPAVWFNAPEVRHDHDGAGNWSYYYIWEGHYYRLRVPHEDLVEGFVTDFQSVLNQIEEDSRCGGELDECFVRGAKRLVPQDSPGGPFDIGRFEVWGRLSRVNPKALWV